MSSSEASKNANASSAPSGGPTDGQDLTVFVRGHLQNYRTLLPELRAKFAGANVLMVLSNLVLCFLQQSRFAQMSDAIIGRNILFTNSFLHVAVHC
ncbi:hypothetical protein JG687_00006539 [Phytophthora cactorum]|uniref:Uncharacterized protein n=1 Tax=Phytophthora cactorum TaxID=29920 RepID=A0A8T1UI21_9STRA|nr:hypothetical protein JG687_00006539 [Phytophthora cactorum]